MLFRFQTQNLIKINFTVFNEIHCELTINCLQNSVINGWFNYVKNIYDQPVDQFQINLTEFQNQKAIAEKHLQQIEVAYKSILDTILELKNNGIAWPIEQEPASFNFEHSWCNRIHRYFTTLQAFKKFNVTDKETVKINPSFEERFQNLIQNLNHHVHFLEHWCTVEKEKPIAKTLTIRPGSVNDLHLQTSTDRSTKWGDFENKEDLNLHSFDHDCDVILAEEILGKTILRSYQNDDNPNYFDTTGHSGYYGGFVILFDDVFKEIYQSNDFNQWLSQHGLSKDSKGVRGDFPVGKIINLTIKHKDKTLIELSKQEFINYIEKWANIKIESVKLNHVYSPTERVIRAEELKNWKLWSNELKCLKTINLSAISNIKINFLKQTTPQQIL